MGCKIIFSPQFLTLALNLTFSPREKEAPLHACLLSADRPANPVAGFSKRRRMILLLLGEKAGLKEDVKHILPRVG
jgi:hypothetical protein